MATCSDKNSLINQLRVGGSEDRKKKWKKLLKMEEKHPDLALSQEELKKILEFCTLVHDKDHRQISEIRARIKSI